jgi:type I restriction enzyme S subunit
MSHRESPLRPSSWTEASLKEIVALVQYGHTASARRSGPGPKFLRITDIQNGNVDWDSVPVCSIDEEQLSKYRLRRGDIVFARTGATTGKSYLIKDCPANAVFASYLIRLRLHDDLDPRFVWYFFQTSRYWRQIQTESSGIAQPGVNAARLQKLRVPLAGCGEQARIVDAIETQLTRLDAAVAALERVQANLKRYRASVLKAAVGGRLVPTEAELARQEGRDYEPASVLLQRILAERRRRWEEIELAAMKAKGKPPQDDKWKAKYKEPAAPDTAGLPELPEGWCWARAEQVSDFITKGTTPPAVEMSAGTGEVPYVKVYNLTFIGALDFSLEPTFVRREVHRSLLARSTCRPGDVLINIVGPPLGKVSIVPDTYEEWNINQAIARFRPINGVRSKYLATLLSDLGIVRWALSRAKATAGQFNLTLEIVRDLPLAIPPLPEQDRIVLEIERRESLVASARRTADACIERTQRLRQSILKWAFEGKLVDQDPNDEPASVLLERIRAEREAAKKEVPVKAKRNGRKRSAA